MGFLAELQATGADLAGVKISVADIGGGRDAVIGNGAIVFIIGCLPIENPNGGSVDTGGVDGMDTVESETL